MEFLALLKAGWLHVGCLSEMVPGLPCLMDRIRGLGGRAALVLGRPGPETVLASARVGLSVCAQECSRVYFTNIDGASALSFSSLFLKEVQS